MKFRFELSLVLLTSILALPGITLEDVLQTFRFECIFRCPSKACQRPLKFSKASKYAYQKPGTKPSVGPYIQSPSCHFPSSLILLSLSDGASHCFCSSQTHVGHQIPTISVELALKFLVPLMRPSVSDIDNHFVSSSSTFRPHDVLYPGSLSCSSSSPLLACCFNFVHLAMMRVHARHCSPSSPRHATPFFLWRLHHLQLGPLALRSERALGGEDPVLCSVRLTAMPDDGEDGRCFALLNFADLSGVAFGRGACFGFARLPMLNFREAAESNQKNKCTGQAGRGGRFEIETRY